MPLDPSSLMPSLFGDELSLQEKNQIQEQAKELDEKITKTIAISSTRKKIDKIDISKLEIKEVVIEQSYLDKDKYIRFG